jgi:hypothetical protein
MEDNEIRKFGHCEECDSEVTDDADEYYITDDGKILCSIECLLEYYGITKIEV